MGGVYMGIYITTKPSLFQPFHPFQSTEKVPEQLGVCGDGRVQATQGEECDDGNKIVTDACLSESDTPATVHAHVTHTTV